MSSIEVAVGIANGKVVLKFPSHIDYIEFDHQNCFDIAEAMCNAAFELRDGVKPVGDTLKAELVEKHRDKLVPRITLMLHSMREDKLKSDGMIALAVIDSVFSEIFS